MALGEQAAGTQGDVVMTIDKLVLGDGKSKVKVPGMAGGLTLDPIDAGTLDLKVDVKDGVATVEKMESKGKDLELSGSGSIRIARPFSQSRADITLAVKFSDAYKQRSDRTKVAFELMSQNPMIKRATGSDGMMRFKLTGSLSALRAVRVDDGAAAPGRRKPRRREEPSREPSRPGARSGVASGADPARQTRRTGRDLPARPSPAGLARMKPDSPCMPRITTAAGRMTTTSQAARRPIPRGDDDAIAAELVDDDGAAPSGRARPLPALREKAGPLARYDPLQAYMRDVQRYTLLTPEEEHERRGQVLRGAATSKPPRGWSPPTCAWS